MARGHFLRTLADLKTDHIGRQVTVAGLTGVLMDVIPVGNQVTLALMVDQARLFTDSMPASTHIEIQSRAEGQR